MNEHSNIQKIGGCAEIPVLKERGQREVFLWLDGYHLASQKNSGCFFSSSGVTDLCSPLAISCRSDDFC